MNFDLVLNSLKEVGFPAVLVLYLLYIIRTDLKQLNDNIIELSTYLKTKLGGGN